MLLIFLIAFGALILDQLSKLLVTGFFIDGTTLFFPGALTYQGETVQIIPKTLSFTYVLNKGAAFGILQNQRIFFLIVTLVICAVGIIILMRMPRKHILLKISSGFIFGGALGNLFDRAVIGAVRDFIDATLVDTVTGYSFPIFNVADIFVVVGIIMLATYILFVHDKIYKTEEKNENKG